MEKQIEIAVQNIVDSVEGGVSEDIMSLLNETINDGHISKEDYNKYEMEIIDMIDSQIFTCTRCNWTVPIEEMSAKNDNWECNDCND